MTSLQRHDNTEKNFKQLTKKTILTSRHITTTNAISRTNSTIKTERWINITTYHLISQKQGCLKAKLSRTEIKQIFKTWPEQLHNHYIIVTFRTPPLHCWNANCNSNTYMSITTYKTVRTGSQSCLLACQCRVPTAKIQVWYDLPKSHLHAASGHNPGALCSEVSGFKIR